MDKPIPKEILDRIKWSKASTQHFDIRPQGIDMGKPCEDCNRWVEHRVVDISIVKELKSQAAHTRFKCTNCGLYKSPLSGVYEWDSVELRKHYTQLNQKKQADE